MNETLTYKLETFEGPLDLLLRLIERNKVSITDIPIALIFEQYMAYLDEAKRMDMELAGEFIVMASELMLIKSRMLLPRTDEKDDPRAELAAALAEYQRMKLAAAYLTEQFEQYSGRYARDTDEVKPEEGVLEGQDAEKLRRAMLAMLRSLDRDETEKISRLSSEKPFERILRAPIVPVGGRIYGVIRYLVKHGDTLFTSILLTARSRSELIATFLAVLELIKKNRVTLRSVGDPGFTGGADDYTMVLNRGKLTDDREKTTESGA